MSSWVLDRLLGSDADAPSYLAAAPAASADVLADDDLQLALHLCYELHYLAGRTPPPIWSGTRRCSASAPGWSVASRRVCERTSPRARGRETRRPRDRDRRRNRRPLGADRVRDRATLDHVRELIVHRSPYQLKEADPHTWAIPRLRGAAKRHLVEIQMGEYGAEDETHVAHAELYASTMALLGLDPTPHAYLDVSPGSSLAISNLVSMLGLHRRHCAALLGHLAYFEMTSVSAMRRYVAGLERLGVPPAARRFHEVHVLADGEHERISADMLRAVVADEPALARDVAFGIGAAALVERCVADRLLSRWDEGRSSLDGPLQPVTP
ncbi:MAG: iron-containing redox enzyme family protein [Ilumatobacteraceae bacterium]